MKTVIRLDQVHKIYQSGENRVHAVRGVTLNIQQGDFVAVMGASGSGKSTLMNILGCLDRPTEGDYFLDDVNVAQLSRSELVNVRNQKIGFVFQSFNLLSRTSALENVELPMLYRPDPVPSSVMRQKAEAALDRVGLAGRSDHYPSQLSGGQQQRVAVARALVMDPELILADEPTGNLDSRTSIEVMGMFQELNDRGITILMVTHELEIAAFARRNIVMRDGVVLKDFKVENRSIATEKLQEHDKESTSTLLEP